MTLEARVDRLEDALACFMERSEQVLVEMRLNRERVYGVAMGEHTMELVNQGQF